MTQRVFYSDFLPKAFFENHSTLHKRLQELDIEISCIPYEWIGTKPAGDILTHWDELLASADAIVVQNRNLPGPRESSLQKILTRIRSGASAVIYCQPGEMAELNGFLAGFDVIGTDWRIDSTEPGTVANIVTFRRKSGEVLDDALVAGAEELTITQPRVLWYGEEASPVVIPQYGKEIVPSEEVKWTERDFKSYPCIVRWAGPVGQLVVVIGGQTFHDPSIGAFEHHFPGGGRVGNAQFSVNLFNRLAYHTLAPNADPRRLCEKIEVNLGEFVVTVLKAAFIENWWVDGIPDRVRKDCATRQEDEKLKFSKECYLMLIDLRTIIEQNWTHFSQYFLAAGLPNQKSKATGWIGEFNSGIRRIVAHPLKPHFAGSSFTTAEIEQLSEWAQLTKRLLDSARSSA